MGETTISRRSAIGAAAGAAALATVIGAKPAGAATGQAIIAGHDNSADARTFLDATKPGQIGFQVNTTGAGSLSLYGATTSGIGVQGSDNTPANGPSGIGVYGTSGAGTGVLGDSDNGTGVWARSTSGTALAVDGVATFDRSGVVVVPAGKKSITVSIAVSSTSMVLATVQQTSTCVLQSAVPNVAKQSFTIRLTKTAPTGGLRIAWLVLG